MKTKRFLSKRVFSFFHLRKKNPGGGGGTYRGGGGGGLSSLKNSSFKKANRGKISFKDGSLGILAGKRRAPFFQGEGTLPRGKEKEILFGGGASERVKVLL